VQALDDETAADTLEEVTPERQVSLLQDMESGRAADILEAMGPDDAADVLGDMADAKARELLGLMEDAEAREVRELLGYPEDSAGGIMTTDYLAVPQRMTAQQTIDELRANRAPAEMAASVTARRSTEVTPDGTQIMISGLKIRWRPRTLPMK
jgi:Mg/Co/Ni transporter MgtE